MLDVAGPAVFGVVPRDATVDFANNTLQSFNAFRVTFDEAIDVSSFSTSDIVSLTGPNGAVTVNAIVPVANSGNTQFDLETALQSTSGIYTLVLGPDIRNTHNNPMDQNRNGIAGEDPADRFTGAVRIVAPRVNSAVPQAASSGAVPTRVLVTFTIPMDPTTFDASDVVTFTGPGGAVPVLSVTPVPGSATQFHVNVNPLSPGGYSLVLGPDIRSVIGNPMDQDLDNMAGEVPDDRFSTTFTLTTSALQVLLSAPSTTPGPVSVRTIRFSRSIDPTTFTLADLTLTGPGGVVPITSITPNDFPGEVNRRFDVNFASQDAVGTYTLTIGPDIRDQLGTQMDQNNNGTPGEVPGDQANDVFRIIGPRVISASPTGFQTGPYTSVRLTFSKSIDPTTFDPTDITYTGPGGVITITSVTPVSGTNNTQFDISFATQVAIGNYTMVIGPDVRDLLGSQMDQNSNGIAGEVPGDRFTVTQFLRGPRIIGFGPQVYPGSPVSSFRVTFNNEMDPSTFTPADVTLSGPGGPITITGVAPVAGSGNRQFDITFAPQSAAGLYPITIGPDIRDVLGYQMDSNVNGINGEIPGDRFSFSMDFRGFGPDGFGYRAAGAVFEAIDLVAGAPGVFTILDNVDDGFAPVDLGTNHFNFYGSVFRGANFLYVSSNGLITLGNGFASGNNAALNTFTVQERAIAPLWDDWGTHRNANDMVLGRFEDTNGDGTMDRLIIEWSEVTNAIPFSPPLAATFQVILSLNTGGNASDIVFNYGGAITVSSSATVGIKEQSSLSPPARFLQISFNSSNPYLQSGSALRFTAPPIGSTIRGQKFNDLDRDGIKDPGEPGLADWTVYLDLDKDGTLDSGEPSTLTDMDGNYVFSNVEPGGYHVAEVLQAGWVQSLPPPGTSLPNGGFEAGDYFADWSPIGSAAITAASFGIGPTEGTYQAFLSPFPSGVTRATLETFLGLGSGALGTIGVPSSHVGSAIKRTIFATAGTTLAIDVSFLTRQTQTAFQDNIGFVSVTPGTVSAVAGRFSLLKPAPTTTFALASDYKAVYYAFPTTGLFTIGVGVTGFPSSSSAFQAALLVDNVRILGTVYGIDVGARQNYLNRDFGNWHPPIAADDSYDVNEEQLLTVNAPGVLGNDHTDLPGGVLTAILVEDADQGMLTLNPDGSFTYLPDIDFNGTDTFTYIASDGVDSNVATVTIEVHNVPPTAGITEPTDGVRGQPRFFTLTASDISVADQAAGFTYDIDWDGNGTVDQTVTGPDGLVVEHIFPTAGTFTIRVTATDKDGGVSDEATHTIAITAVALQPDPDDPSKTALVAGGTTGNDVINLIPIGPNGSVRVLINDANHGTFVPTGRIIAYGQAGDDVIHVVSAITLTAELYGGADDDLLQGGSGLNLLIGGTGTDQLEGGLSHDVLIAGADADLLFGKGEEDLLIASSTAYDLDEAALRAILREWTRTDQTYEERVDHLRNGGGLNGDVILDGTTVFDDAAIDELTGGGDRDWFFAQTAGPFADLLVDRRTDEFVN
jgi:hypothetical protein